MLRKFAMFVIVFLIRFIGLNKFIYYVKKKIPNNSVKLKLKSGWDIKILKLHNYYVLYHFTGVGFYIIYKAYFTNNCLFLASLLSLYIYLFN